MTGFPIFLSLFLKIILILFGSFGKKLYYCSRDKQITIRDMEYKILQLKHNEEAHKFLFLPYREDRVPSKDLYDVVYTGEVKPDDTLMVLERLFVKFNTNHPADFKGHSLSVSDVVELDGKFYYCDSFGYEEIKNW